MPDILAVGLFCEDIREEKSGQDTLIGILPDNLNLAMIGEGQFPTLAKLCLYVRVLIDPNIDPGPISIRVVAPGDEPAGGNEFSSEVIGETRNKAIEAGAPMTGLISKIVWAGIPITKPGRLRAYLKAGDKETLCGALNFRLIKSAPTASVQPPSQSPAAFPAKGP